MLRAISEEAQGRGIGAAHIREAVNETLSRSQEIARLGCTRGEEYFTTRNILREEQKLLFQAEQSRNNDTHTLSKRTVNSVIKQHDTITAEQERALRHITEEKGSIQIVSGVAGSGKTYLLDAAREAWEKEGYKVLGCAVAGKAARGLEEGAGIRACSIAKLLHELDRTECDGRKIMSMMETRDSIKELMDKWPPQYASILDLPKMVYAYWIGLKLERAYTNITKALDSYIDLTPKTVLVVDEAGMVDTRQMAKLVDAARQRGAKVVLTGEREQIQAIGRGGAFAAIEDKLGSARLTEIIRQRLDGKDPNPYWKREAVNDFAEGRAGKALHSLAARGQLHVAEDRKEAIKSLVASWKADGVKNPAENLIFSGFRQDAFTLNRMAQEERKRAGELSDKYLNVNGEKIYEGECVLFTRKSTLLGVENGSLGEVLHIDEKQRTMKVKLDDGTRTSIKISHYDDLQLGYAMTTHKGQGATVENAYILAGGTMQDREISYVQASRARGETRIFTDRREAGEELETLTRQMEKSRQKELASSLLSHAEEQRPIETFLLEPQTLAL